MTSGDRFRYSSIDLIDFRLHEISKLDGPIATELGRALRDLVQREVERRREKLVVRINRQIEKHRDELRLSARKALHW